MARTTIDDRAHPGHASTQDVVHEQPSGVVREHRSRFWWHFAQMLVVMVPGMIGASYLVVVTTGAGSYQHALARYPTLCLLAMAVGMTAPMVAWMAVRRMGTRNTLEMALVMTVPVIPFLCLVWFGVTESALCGVYCAVTVVAMLALMGFRRDTYSAHG